MNENDKKRASKMVMMHPNSEIAFAESFGELGRREKECYAVLTQSMRPLTDRQVMEALRFSDPNAVRPRLTELCKDLWVREVGWTQDHVSGKRVRLLEAVPAWKRMAILRSRNTDSNQLKLNFDMTKEEK